MGKDDLRIDPLLLAKARAAGVPAEKVAEHALKAALDAKTRVESADERAALWAEENAEAIADYNRRIAERGVFSDGLRTW